MGTNYYLKQNTCPHCGRGDEPLHIGKSSAGWCFSLRVHPEERLLNLGDWIQRWNQPHAKIENEYGDLIPPDEMLDRITNRGWEGKELNEPGWYRANHAEPGPNGLSRHALGGSCVGHGEGTWDLIKGEFS